MTIDSIAICGFTFTSIASRQASTASTAVSAPSGPSRAATAFT